MSGYPGEKAGYGQSDLESYPIGTFNSDTLSDEEYQMSEGDAYERLRVSSMERGQRMVDVAQALLNLAAGRSPRR